jgi:hypothetical protein
MYTPDKRAKHVFLQNIDEAQPAARHVQPGPLAAPAVASETRTFALFLHHSPHFITPQKINASMMATTTTASTAITSSHLILPV